MKISFVFLFPILLICWQSLADESLARPAGQIESASTNESKLTALRYYEVLHPSNKRDPSWPDRLTISDEPPPSQKRFEQTLATSWRLVYQCNGAPAPSNFSMFDGIHGDYLEFQFEGNKMLRYAVNKKEPSTRKLLDESSFTIQPMGNGVFKVETERFGVPMLLKLVRIRETDEFALDANDSFGSRICPNHEKAKGFFVPSEAPTS